MNPGNCVVLEEKYLSGIHSRVSKISIVLDLEFDRNLQNWLKNGKFLQIWHFCSELQNQNENAESTEFLEKIPLCRYY